MDINSNAGGVEERELQRGPGYSPKAPTWTHELMHHLHLQPPSPCPSPMFQLVHKGSSQRLLTTASPRFHLEISNTARVSPKGASPKGAEKVP